MSSLAVGAHYRPRVVELSRRDLLSFAAGIDLPWPTAFDDKRDGGLIGFPTYCASLEFNAFQGGLADGASLGLTPAERLRGVHAGQDTSFHAPFRPGDRLSTGGAIVAVRQTRVGVLVTVLAETRRRSGEPIATSWVSQIYRDVALAGPDREAKAAPPTPVRSRDRLARRTEIAVTRAMPHVYAECAAIWNPIHSERTVAIAAGLPEIILQGTATWSFACREVVDAFCDGDPTKLARVGCRFSGMAAPGEVLMIEVYEPHGDVVAFEVARQDGAPVLTGGFARIRR